MTMVNRLVLCAYLKRQSPGLAMPPYPGPLGERLYQEISQEAWALWQAKQTMLINENKLTMFKPEHRLLLEQWMIQFLFEGDPLILAGYRPPSA
jgi:Fe-S cluster biosynthesis and repair protein YggX